VLGVSGSSNRRQKRFTRILGWAARTRFRPRVDKTGACLQFNAAWLQEWLVIFGKKNVHRCGTG